jgi:uncharacterized delta-60 repeat protein
MSTKKCEPRALGQRFHHQTIRVGGLATIMVMPLLFLLALPQVRAQSALDGFDPNANGTVRVVVVQPDGKILIGGDFTTLSPNGGPPVTRNHIARINPDGTLDTVFDPNATGTNATVQSIAVQADGKVFVGGSFTSIGGQPRNNMARLDATTGLADSLDPNANNTVFAVAVQADGKILAGGFFNSIGGQPRNRIARLDSTTGLADSFDAALTGPEIFAITVQPDGKILAGGFFTTIGGQTRNNLARLDPVTGLADSFAPDASDEVYAIAVQADGKVLAGGFFTIIGGQSRNSIARLDATTGLADSFNPNANNGVFAIAVQADGKILAGGDFFGIGGQQRHQIARLDPATGLADSFDPSANNVVQSIAVQADGKILAGGGFTALSPNGGASVTRNRIARLETDGRLDRTLNLGIAVPTPSSAPIAAPTVNPPATDRTGDVLAAIELPGGNCCVFATAVQPDGKILIGGSFADVLGITRHNIARLNSDGTLDTAFDPNATNTVYSIAVQADGKILAGGEFSGIGGQQRHQIARLDPATGLADSFDPSASGGTVFSIAVQTDGKILAAGDFTNIGGQPRNRIARLDATTGLADPFNPDSNSFVWSIAVQTDGKILAGGEFGIIGGQTRNGIARLDATSGLPDAFNPNANSDVRSILVQWDGRILAGGDFSSIGGQTRRGLARLDAVTGLADGFNPNTSGGVDTIAVQADGKILVGGQFSSIGGQSRSNIARLDPVSGLADSFDPNANQFGYVWSLAVQTDGKILAGGSFVNIGGQGRGTFARLRNDIPSLPNLAVTQTAVNWTRVGSGPQFKRVTFEYSTDNVSYILLGNGTVAGGNWSLTNLGLPTGLNFYIRARGYYATGFESGSQSISESVRNAFLAGPISTPTPTPTPSPTPTPTATSTAIPSATPTGTPTLTPTPTTSTPTLTPTVTPTGTPTPTATVTPTATPSASPTPTATSTVMPSATPTSTPSVTPSMFGNISTRLRVETGDNVLIGGFIITGTQPKKIIVRAIGPSLSSFFPGVLGDPVLELRDSSGALLATNDNWRSDQEAEILATGIPPADDLESAIVATLPANNAAYTAIVRGVNNATGIGVVEAYDLDHTVDSKLGNISTRGLVQTGDNVMIGGLIVLGQNPLRVIVRAIGPSLPVPGALGDPILELHDGNGALIAANDSWRSDQEAEIIATGIPPASDLEAAIVRNFAPGNYTAIVRGVNNTTGVAVVEAYGLN